MNKSGGDFTVIKGGLIGSTSPAVHLCELPDVKEFQNKTIIYCNFCLRAWKLNHGGWARSRWHDRTRWTGPT